MRGPSRTTRGGHAGKEASARPENYQLSHTQRNKHQVGWPERVLRSCEEGQVRLSIQKSRVDWTIGRARISRSARRSRCAQDWSLPPRRMPKEWKRQAKTWGIRRADPWGKTTAMQDARRRLTEDVAGEGARRRRSPPPRHASDGGAG